MVPRRKQNAGFFAAGEPGRGMGILSVLSQSQIFGILSGTTVAPLIIPPVAVRAAACRRIERFCGVHFSGYAPGMLQLGPATILAPDVSLMVRGTASFMSAAIGGSQSIAGHCLAVLDDGGTQYVISLAKYATPAVVLPGAFTVSITIYYQSYVGVA